MNPASVVGLILAASVVVGGIAYAVRTPAKPGAKVQGPLDQLAAAASRGFRALGTGGPLLLGATAVGGTAGAVGGSILGNIFDGATVGLFSPVVGSMTLNGGIAGGVLGAGAGAALPAAAIGADTLGVKLPKPPKLFG